MRQLERFGPISDVAFRSLFSVIFIVAGVGHFAERAEMLERLEAAPLGHLAYLFGSTDTLMTMSGGVLIASGFLLLVGFQSRLAALALALTIIPITITTHLGNPGHVGPMLKNVALLGGLIHFFVRGAGAYSFDEWRQAATRER